ncbi:MAG TPA: endonuclease MutS2 [Terriglobales bacterium]
MQHTSRQALEFDKLLEIIAGYTQSVVGRERVLALTPTTDRDWITRQQQLTAEVRNFLRSGGGFDFAGLFDARDLLNRARIIGVALDVDELRRLITLAERAMEWRGIAASPSAQVAERWSAVPELAAQIADFNPLLRAFRGKIEPDGTIADDASPALYRIRRDIESQQRAIERSLRSHLRTLSAEGSIQEDVITIRGDRFVIPVKVEQRRKVGGVVHGASSSGQTVYIEPIETIEQNNELLRLMADEQAEVHRILLELTRVLGEYAAPLAIALDVLSEMEVQFAKARFAVEYSATEPHMVEDNIALTNARHPVLMRNLRAHGKRVVPLNYDLREHEQDGLVPREIIISGPNTGGKTVGLKTTGILALAAQAGIPVTAEDAELPIFDCVLADIGDSQSIEQNLSTFSAHVTNIDMISKSATNHSLVLLDELGSATDPEEGAALAVAIADHFRRIGAFTIISTHHTSLKVYATNTPGVLNAAVGFDEATLQPTYELRVGVPGASAGINIAQRLGLNPQIISEARAKLATQTQDIALFLDRLHQELDAAEQERLRLRRREAEVDAEKRRLEQEGLREQKQRIRDLERKLGDLFTEFEYQAREAVNAVQDRVAQQKLSKEAERRIAKLRREFQESFNSTVVAHTTGADRNDENAQPHIVKHVAVGDTVKLKSVGKTGVVQRKIDDNMFEVQMGIMKMRVPRSDIAAVVVPAAQRPAAVTPVQAARSRGISVQLKEDDYAPTSEINVIGKTVDEATDEVERFLDQSFLAGLSRVRIVHGSGMGILRKALRSYLQRHPHVATWAEPPQNQGGAGATIVDLRH